MFDKDQYNHKLYTAIFGLAIGDALGVPYEFMERGWFKCEDMVGGGSHNQPAGTWSDDTSMTLATSKSIKDNNGKVVDTLEASLWSLTHNYSYDNAVLEAVNLGDDTDTTGAVTGGLAALAYNVGDIGKDSWFETLRNKEAILDCLF